MAKETKKAEETVENTTPQVEETNETKAEKVDTPKAKKTTKAKKTEEVAEEAPAKVEVVEEAPAEVEFDWYAYENDGYSETKVAELNDIYEGSLNSIIEKSVVDGTVIQLTDKEAVINVKYKSEAIVSRYETFVGSDFLIGDWCSACCFDSVSAQSPTVCFGHTADPPKPAARPKPRVD